LIGWCSIESRLAFRHYPLKGGWYSFLIAYPDYVRSGLIMCPLFRTTTPIPTSTTRLLILHLCLLILHLYLPFYQIPARAHKTVSNNNVIEYINGNMMLKTPSILSKNFILQYRPYSSNIDLYRMRQTSADLSYFLLLLDGEVSRCLTHSIRPKRYFKLSKPCYSSAITSSCPMSLHIHATTEYWWTFPFSNFFSLTKP
jgi:hypothetical protein